MITDTLYKIGLSKNTAAVFAAVLEHGPCHVASLVKTTKKHRQIIYDSLDDLEKRGLVFVSKSRGKNLYAVGDPTQLLVEIKQQEVAAAQLVEVIEKKRADVGEQARVYAGPNAYFEALEDFRFKAEQENEYIVFGGQNKDWLQFIEPRWQNHIDEVFRLKRKGVSTLALFFEDEWESSRKVLEPYVGSHYTIKVAKERSLPETVWIAGPHLYILTPVQKPLIVHIESAELTRKYKDYFWNQWTKADLIKPARVS